MSANDNITVLSHLVEAFNTGNLAMVDEVFSPNFVLHNANHPHWPRRLAGVRKMFTVMYHCCCSRQLVAANKRGMPLTMCWADTVQACQV